METTVTSIVLEGVLYKYNYTIVDEHLILIGL